MKSIIYAVLAIWILSTIPTAMSQTGNSQAVVNLMIDVSAPLNPADEQSEVDRDNIKNIYNSMIKENIPSTWFLTQDVASSETALYLTQLGLYGDIEFGISGNHSGEKLSSQPYSKQLAILEGSKKYASAAHVCGKNEKAITGFKPQSFDQNQDTYKALDAMGMQYDAGFQSGILYAPGHENDVWPYLVEGHTFYAVPMSTYTLSDKRMVLSDSYFKESGLNGSQWYDALAAKLNETRSIDEPLVISLTTSISGLGDYLAALKKFIAYARSEDASFVNTSQLVDMGSAGVHNLSALPVRINGSTGCRVCDQSKNNNISNAPLTISLNMSNMSQLM